MTAPRRTVLAAGLGVLVLGAGGCGPDVSVSVNMATTDARSRAHDDAAALQEALGAAVDASAVRDVTDSWSRTSLGEQAAIHESGGDIELVMVYEASENQGGGWFSSEAVVRLCTRLHVHVGDAPPRVDLVGTACPEGLSPPSYGDSFVEVALE